MRHAGCTVAVACLLASALNAGAALTKEQMIVLKSQGKATNEIAAAVRSECVAFDATAETLEAMEALFGTEVASAIRDCRAAQGAAGQVERDRNVEDRFVEPKSGLTFARVPAGEFAMGCTPPPGMKPRETNCSPENSPPVRVTITKDFWMATTETTVAAYRKCVSAGACEAIRETGTTVPQLPMMGMADVKDMGYSRPMLKIQFGRREGEFCSWIGGRLPTEAEWEYAARGGLTEKPFPWGEELPSCEKASYDTGGPFRWKPGCGTKVPSPVGSRPANAYGLYDMAGNAAELVLNVGDYTQMALQDPAPSTWKHRGRLVLEPEGNAQFLLRGGKWDSTSDGLFVYYRGYLLNERTAGAAGFRCVMNSVK